MVPYHVTFAVPSWVSEGLKANTLEVIGGVVRHVDTKQVAMWLRPGLEEASKSLAPQLGAFATLSAGMLASTAATGGMSMLVLAGFAAMKQELKKANAKLDTIIEGQDRLHEGMSELLDEPFNRARRAIDTAIETIAMEEERRDAAKLQQPIAELREQGKLFAARMERILKRAVPLASAALFVEVAALFALVARAKSRALFRYQSLGAADKEAQADLDAYAGLRARFLEPLRAPEAHLHHFIQLTERQDAEMRCWLPGLPKPQSLNFLRQPDMPKDAETMSALLDLMLARAGAPPAGIVVMEQAPEGWLPEIVSVAAASRGAHA